MHRRRQCLALLLGMALAVAALSGVDLAGSEPPVFSSKAAVHQLDGEQLIHKSRQHARRQSRKRTRSTGRREAASAASPAVALPPPPPPPPSFPEQVVVPSDASQGRVTVAQVQAGRTYRIEVSGAYLWDDVRTVAGSLRPRADAECAGAVVAQFVPHLLDATEAGSDPLDLYINGKPVEWRAVRPDSAGCSPEHLYEFFLTAATTGALRFAIKDADHSDNIGALTVRITD